MNGATITLSAYSGTLVKENGTAVVSLTKTGDGNGPGASGGNGTDDYGSGIALVAGTNAPSAANNSDTLDYVAGYSAIESPVTAEGNDTDRTGWLAGS